jgi:protein-L-isoaspartate(D-aspartate) O-methyltransferase
VADKEDERLEERLRMVETQIAARGVREERVLSAMRRVPRHLFVPVERTHEAYGDGPLSIGRGQTISQPYVVASMLEILGVKEGEKVLEVGLGSGYSAAVLSEVAGEAWSVERDPDLAGEAVRRLRDLGYDRVHAKVGDGTLGWPEEGPFDAIMVTAGGPSLPKTLLSQLKPGGRLLMPVGDRWEQTLVLARRSTAGAVSQERMYAVRFVPLVGAEGWEDAT